MSTLSDEERWEEAIQRAYDERLRTYPDDPQLGWRLLYSPRRVLSGSRVAFLGFNPGGSTINPDHGVFSSERGSAYRKDVENWGSSARLQEQVIEVFKRLDVSPEAVLAGNLVPFRSPSEDSLKGANQAITFGRSLWKEILLATRPSVVITMGGAANREISHLLNVSGIETHYVGWGNYTASRGQTPYGTWIGLPHLSRFAIMKREASQPALNEIFRNLSGT